MSLGLAATLLALAPAMHSDDGAPPPSDCDNWIPRAEQASLDRDLSTARTLFQRCLDGLAEWPDKAVEARATSGLSEVELLAGNYDLALELAQRALDVARRSGEPTQEYVALQKLGDAWFYQREYEAALESFQAALELVDENPSAEAHALKNIGITYDNMDRPDQAMHYLERAVARLPLDQDPAFAVTVLGNLGTTYRKLGAHRHALANFERALALAEQRGVPEEIVDILGRIGALKRDAGLPEQSLSHFQRAAAMVDEVGAGHRFWLLAGLAGVYDELGRKEQALELYRRILEISDQSGDPYGLIFSHKSLAWILAANDPVAAELHLERAWRIGRSIGFDWAEGAEAGLARLYRARGERDRAIDAYAASLDALEAFRDTRNSASSKLSLLRHNRFVYDELIETLLERHAELPAAGDDARAFRVYERGRARLMLERIVEARLEPGEELSPALRNRQLELQRRLSTVQELLLDQAIGEGDRARLRDELIELELESDELLAATRHTSRRRALVRLPDPVTVERAAALLDAQTALVAYAFLPRRTAAFVVTSTGLEIRELAADRRVVASQVTNMLDLLNEGGELWRPVARKLGRDLVEPVLPLLGPEIRDLVVVPDDSLNLLPFETLILADANGRAEQRLVERYSVAYVPSATLLEEIARSEDRADRRGAASILLVANPKLGSNADVGALVENERSLYEEHGFDIGPIPFSAREARSIWRHAGPGSVRCAGEEATEGKLKTLALDRFDILHFATHALLQANRPRRSALVLGVDSAAAEDGFLRAREVSRLELSAELVVLSACSSARGRVDFGDGVQGLAQAFFHAGARSVVGSLWEVDDRQTASFMSRFYRRLAEGHSKTRALRLAKLDRLRHDPSSWAAFVLVGEPHATVPLSAARPTWEAWMLVLPALGLFVALGLWRVLARRRASRAGAS